MAKFRISSVSFLCVWLLCASSFEKEIWDGKN